MAVERESPTWRAVKAHCEAEIEKARDRLETIDGYEERNRGIIMSLRSVLAIVEDKPEITGSTRLY